CVESETTLKDAHIPIVVPAGRLGALLVAAPASYAGRDRRRRRYEAAPLDRRSFRIDRFVGNPWFPRREVSTGAILVAQAAVLVVDLGTDAGLVGEEVDAVDVKALLVLVVIVVAEHAVEQELLDLGVVGRLVRCGKPVAEDRDVHAGAGRAGAEKLRHGIGH